MARIRALKPEMSSHETIAKVSRDARLLFVWLIGDADDEGRFVATPKRLAGTLYPYDDDIEPADVSRWMTELVKVGLVRLYESAGGKFGLICSWSQHQKPSHPAPSRLPAPPTSTSENVTNISGTSPEDDGTDTGSPPPSSSASASSTGSGSSSDSSSVSALPKPIDLALSVSAHRWPDEPEAHGAFSAEIAKAAKRSGQNAGRLTRIAAHVMRLHGLTKLGALSHPARAALMSRLPALGALVDEPDDLDLHWKTTSGAAGWPNDIGQRVQRIIDTWETGPDRTHRHSSPAVRQSDIYDDIEADFARMNGHRQIAAVR